MEQAAPFPSVASADSGPAPASGYPVAEHPSFRALLRARRRFAWRLTALMLAAYFGYILVLAFRPALLGQPLVPGQPMTVGILVGFGMFALTFALVALYVYRANTVYDDMIRNVREGVAR